MPRPFDAADDAMQLSRLAMRYRNRENRNDASRAAIAAEYAVVLERIIANEDWDSMPAFEDQLAAEHMPQAYWDYLGMERPKRVSPTAP
jgi:hypothetical protein